jgi:hypothetical protein
MRKGRTQSSTEVCLFIRLLGNSHGELGRGSRPMPHNAVGRVNFGPFVYLSVYLFLSLSMRLFISLFMFVWSSLSLFLSMFVCLFISVLICAFLYLVFFVSLFVFV